jgi:hypothetical protein
MSEPDTPETPPTPPPPPPPPQQQYGAYPGSYPPPPQQPYAGYPPPPQQPYAGYPPSPAAPKNGLGLAALVVAIAGLLLCWTVVGGIVLGVVAVVLGFVGWNKAKRGEANNGGIAVAGIVLGVLAVIASVVFIVIGIGLFKDFGGSDYMDCLSRAGSDQEAMQQCSDQFTERVEDELSITVTPTP